VDLAFHDAESASVGFFRLTHGIFRRRSPPSRTSDTSVAPGSRARTFDWVVLPGCQGRFLRLSVKRRRSLRPEVSSAVGGHSRACVNRFQLVRVHVCFRDEVALGALVACGSFLIAFAMRELPAR